MIRAVIACALVLMYCAHAHAFDNGTMVRAVLNEAEGEPYSSKLAHAHLFLNRARAGLALGSSGINSAKVRARLARVPAHIRRDAERAVEVARAGKNDPTNGALYCENVKKFGVPAYIKKALREGRVRECARAGDVVFWTDKK